MEADGVNLRITDREKLEGWEFLKLINRERSLKPHFQYLESSSRG